jgi:hypothetical protein
MPVYRYVKNAPGEGHAPEHLDVTFAGEGREGLDASMRDMGFEFFQVISKPEGASRSAGPLFFPGADAPEPITPRMPRAAGHAAAVGAAVPELGVGPSDAPPAMRPGMTSGKGAFGMALSTRAAKALRVFRGESRESAETVALTEDAPAAKAQRGLSSLLRRAPAALALVIVAVLVVQAKVIDSGFIDDDFVRALDARLKSDWGFASERFHGLFAGSYELGYLGAWQLFQLDSTWYFRSILLCHVVNAALVYGVARALSGRTAIAAVAAGLWGITPGFQPTLQSLAAFGAVISAGTLCWALLEIARAAANHRPPTVFALLRVNLALLLCAGGMPGAWLGVFVFPLVAHLLLPPESARGRSALFTLPAALGSLAPAVAFFKDVAPALGQPFSVFRIFVELLAYGTGVTLASPFTNVHAHGRGAGVFRFPSYGFAILISAAVALLVLGFIVVRLRKADAEERREIAGLLFLALALYLGVALHRGEFLGKRSIDWIAARSPQHYCANVPIVLALVAALARVRLREGFFTRGRVGVMAALGVALVLVDRSVSESTHALRPGRAARVTDMVDEAIRQVVRGVSDGEIAFIQNDDFPTVSRARERGLPAVRFPGIGAYWALTHQRAVPISPAAAVTVTAGASSAAPAPSTCGATPALRTSAGSAETPVRFVVMDDALLKTIKKTFRPSIAEYFVSPAFVNARGASVLTLDAAEAETLASLERAKRGMSRVNDL